MEYEEYGRRPLDNYTTGELQAEIERRKEQENQRKEIEKAIENISKNIDNSTLIKKTEYFYTDYYEISVRKI